MLVSGFGPKAVARPAEIGDGFVTTSPDQDAVELCRSGCGKGPAHADTKVCFMEPERRGRWFSDPAHDPGVCARTNWDFRRFRLG